MDTHYVCSGGCGTVSDNSGVCMSEGCPKQNQPLVACSCRDDKHRDVEIEKGEAEFTEM